MASRTNVETLANFSSFGMGGVSHPSQMYALKLLEPVRVAQAKGAVSQHYAWQRERYFHESQPHCSIVPLLRPGTS